LPKAKAQGREVLLRFNFQEHEEVDAPFVKDGRSRWSERHASGFLPQSGSGIQPRVAGLAATLG